MVFRKIIKFGDSSYVVSLPKGWVNNNGLNKGDVLSIEEEAAELKITPQKLMQSVNTKIININFDGNIKKLKSELIFAYIDNYSLINIKGKDLFDHLDGIKDIVEELVALELIQKKEDLIVLKDFLNVQDVSIHDTLRRTDRIVLSMAEDVRMYLSGKKDTITNLLMHKEKDVNRLSNLIFKTLKKSFNPNDRTILKLNLGDIFYYWETTLFVEKIGDQLKLMPAYLLSKVPPECIKIFDRVMVQYTNSMKANFTSDYDLAIDVLVNKKKIYTDAEELASKLPHGKGYSTMIERAKNINDYAGNIAKALLKLKVGRDKN